MKSFGLLRTNSCLTTNVKVVYSDNDNKLYFESFDADPNLSDNKYKRFLIPEDSYYHKLLGKYWKNTPIDIAFDPKDEEDYDIMYKSYDNQLDDTYISGGTNVKDTDYPEEFEYLAPLHIHKGDIPTDFIIFRIDGAGMINLNSSNFKTEILDKMKVVSRFDLSKENKLGKFLDNSFNESNLPLTSLDINFNENEFTYWNGIDYNTGEFTSKGKLMGDEFKKEMTFTQGFDILTSGFKENQLIYPYIINLKFLFDDTPANENELRKWSINRYMGFYGNLEEVTKITAYRPPTLRSGMRLTDNIFTLNGVNVDPFERGYKSDRVYYIEYQSNFYLISKIDDNTFKVISDIDLPNNVDSNFNLNTITFGTNNEVNYLNGNTFDISDESDVLLIEINGQFHRIRYDGSNWVILSDYKFSVTNNIFRYFINKSDPNYTTIINLNNIDENNPPLTFKIYRLNFSPIKDLDYNFLDTEYSKFDYEFENTITHTEEPKLYEDDISFDDMNKPIERYVFKNKVESIPVASEYLATSELFEVLENNKVPNKMWRKNISFVKWGIEGSLSNNDYPYLFNINKKGDDFNRTTNTEELIPNRSSRNLDYFYTSSEEGHNFGYNDNVIHQSLSIVNNSFEIDKYFGINYTTNYFDEYFGRNQTINSSIYNRSKYSYFLSGDQVSPNQTIFKGLNISLYRVDSILTEIINDVKTISSLNVKGTDTFKDYKFSILLNSLNKDIDNDFSTISNTSEWKLLKNWSKNETYYPGDIVLFDSTQFKNSDGEYGFPGYGTSSATGSSTVISYTYPDGTIEPLTISEDGGVYDITGSTAKGTNDGFVELYKCTATTSVTVPTQTLEDDIANWQSFPSSGNTIFYQPNRAYTGWDSISGSYSYLVDSDNYKEFFCYYKGEFYKSLINNTNKTPDYIEISTVNGLKIDYWEKIEEYSTTKNYSSDEIVTLNGDLYYYNGSTQELSIIFSFKYSKENNYNQNDIITFNDNFYIANTNGSYLDNGINIYINKDHKNVLIHIYFNDNLVSSYNVNREDLYCPELQQLTANNFIDIINNITLKNGFINPLKYYVIENGSSTLYTIENIEDLPYILQIESPTQIEFYSHSLNKKGVGVNQNILKIKKKLINNNISNINELNYLADQPVGVKYDRLDIFNHEDRTDILYRFNGNYNPIFNEINLFDIEENNRYSFNTNLNEFGEIREVVKSKVNEDSNLLRIEDDSYKSIYPQVDEIGYFIDKHNIFKSTWDTNYYKKTTNN
jgi:hypothetical protein